MSTPSIPISSSPRSPPSPPSAPCPNRFRDAIRSSFKSKENITESNIHYRRSIITIVAQDFEKKTGSKLNVNPKSKTAASANERAPVSVTPAAPESKNRRERLAKSRGQVVYGSAEWHTANDGFVKISETEKEERKTFCS